MTIATVIMADPAQPAEIQAWFDANPTIVISEMIVSGNIVYLIY
jgi:hypothetical protein